MSIDLPVPPVPSFEGAVVEATRVKIGSPVLDLPDVVLHVDDEVRIVLDCRVTSVTHTVDGRSGRLLRVQVAKPYEARISRG